MGGSNSINIFLSKIFGFYFLWLISENWLSHVSVVFNRLWTFFYHYLLLILNNVSTFVLEVIGYEVVNNYRSVAIVGSYGVVIGNHCIGFGLMFAFFALIFSYPAPWKKKLWFIPAGMSIIMIANIIRVVVLTISIKKKGNFVDLDQHDFFNYIVYVLIFLLWVIWILLIVPESDVFSRTKNSGSTNDPLASK